MVLMDKRNDAYLDYEKSEHCYTGEVETVCYLVHDVMLVIVSQFLPVT